MSDFVLDASVAAAWCLADEQSPETDALLNALRSGRRALTPGLWRWEIANVLITCVRRKRLHYTDIATRFALLESLPIESDPRSATHAWGAATSLAASHALSVYDASYLDLAIRTGLPLATRDSALARVAPIVGVTLELP